MEIDEAVQSAKAFAARSLGPERTANIRLEEIESSVVDGQPVWLIALSSGMNLLSPAISKLVGVQAEREYKVFTVDKETGEVFAMKIRMLALPGA